MSLSKFAAATAAPLENEFLSGLTRLEQYAIGALPVVAIIAAGRAVKGEPEVTPEEAAKMIFDLAEQLCNEAERRLNEAALEREAAAGGQA